MAFPPLAGADQLTVSYKAPSGDEAVGADGVAGTVVTVTLPEDVEGELPEALVATTDADTEDPEFSPENVVELPESV